MCTTPLNCLLFPPVPLPPGSLQFLISFPCEKLYFHFPLIIPLSPLYYIYIYKILFLSSLPPSSFLTAFSMYIHTSPNLSSFLYLATYEGSLLHEDNLGSNFVCFSKNTKANGQVQKRHEEFRECRQACLIFLSLCSKDSHRPFLDVYTVRIAP